MAEFRMPSLGADMTEGTLLEWLVAPGDVVHRGDIIAVVDTSKSAIDIEVFEDGVVSELLVPPGTTVPVGAPLARLVDLDASAPAVAVVEPDQPPVVPHREGERIAASPFARRRAAELGVDLATVPGHGGVISVADVEAAVAAPAAAPASAADEPTVAEPITIEPIAPEAPVAPPAVAESSAADRTAAMREAIGRLMARSKREIPHYYLQTTIDMRTALDWLADENAVRPVAERILPAALLLKASAVAAREMPGLNGFYVDGAFQPSPHVHLGVAVALRGGGLIAPALHDADRLSLADVMAGMKDLVSRARSGRLRSSEMSDPTITVTNLGEQGAEAVHGVIYPPQVALVGFGRIVDRPWAIDGMLTVRPLVTATLAADHRVTDGHVGGLYLDAVASALAEPESLRGGSS